MGFTMPGRQVLAFGVALLLVFGVGSRIGRAEAYHSQQFGYTTTVPAGWKKIPDDLVQKAMATLYRADAKNVPTVDAAFEPAEHKNWFDYPYVMCSCTLYSKVGQQGQINEDQFAEFTRQMTGTNAKKTIDSQMNNDAKKLLDDLTMGQPELDAPNRRFMLSTTLQVPGVGPVRNVTYGYFGRYSLVEVSFCVEEKNWVATAGSAQQFFDSFRFDPDTAYSVAEAAQHPASRSIWSGVGQSAVVGGVLALIGGLTVRRGKKK
jgi:hypothetical protein